MIETQIEANIASAFGGGSGASVADPLVISAPEHIASLARYVNEGRAFSGVWFRVTADIDLGGASISPIGEYVTAFDMRPFAGGFIGGGHTIHNFTIKSSDGRGAALFGCLDGATVRDLKIGNFTIVGDGDTAALAAFAVSAKVTECHAGGNINVAGAALRPSVGGLIGTASSCDISSSTSGCTIGASGCASVGGIVGTARSGTSIDGCRNVRPITATGCDSVGGLVGTIVGSDISSSSAESSVTAISCSRVGGAVGEQNGGTIKSCRASGDVVSKGGSDACVGGLVGYAGGSVTSCASGGDVEMQTHQDRAEDRKKFSAGGLVGVADSAEITGSASLGRVSGDGSLGGFVAVMRGTDAPSRVRDCCSSGDVVLNGPEDSALAAGFVGVMDHDGSSVSVIRCYSFGNLYGTTRGFVASNVRGVISKCFWRKDEGVNASKGTAHAIGTMTTEEFAVQDSFERAGWSFDVSGPVWGYTSSMMPPRPYPVDAPVVRKRPKKQTSGGI